MGPLSSPVVTSYRLPIVTIGLSLTVFAVLRLVINGRTDGIGLATGCAAMHEIVSFMAHYFPTKFGWNQLRFDGVIFLQVSP